MWLPEEGRFTARFRYVEVARYVPDLDRVIRQQKGPKGDRRPVFFAWDAIEAWRNRRVNDNTGLYTSVFQRDAPQVEARAIGNLYFDLDDKDHPNLAHVDAISLAEHLLGFFPPEALRIYFTGLKGFHVEVEAVALGVSSDVGTSTDVVLPRLYRYIATQLAELVEIMSLDFKVYDTRRMWRLPDSRHQGTGLYKIHLDFDELLLPLERILKMAEEPRWFVPPAQEFSGAGNEWFKSQKEAWYEHNISRFLQDGVPRTYSGNADLDTLARELAETKEGGRDDLLNKNAFAAFRAGLDPAQVEEAMLEACRINGLPEREAMATIASARRAAAEPSY